MQSPSSANDNTAHFSQGSGSNDGLVALVRWKELKIRQLATRRAARATIERAVHAALQARDAKLDMRRSSRITAAANDRRRQRAGVAVVHEGSSAAIFFLPESRAGIQANFSQVAG